MLVVESPIPYDTICNLKKLIIRGFLMPKDQWRKFAKNVNFLSLKLLELSNCWETKGKRLKYIAKSENFKNLELGLSFADRTQIEAFCASANFQI
jgi:hypothetical protein